MPKAPDTTTSESESSSKTSSIHNKHSRRVASVVAGVGLAVLSLAIAAPAAAQVAGAPPAAPPDGAVTPPAPLSSTRPPLDSPGNPYRLVGGHIGAAVPLVSFHHQGKTTQTASDQLTIAVPIGVTVHMSPDWVVDFETIVGNNVKPAGGSGLTVDPGIVYVGGPVALGLRIKFDIAPTGPVNVGLIPLVHKGLVDFGDMNWFIEAAFPITYSRVGSAASPTGQGINDYTLAIVLHTGIAF
jgi:hypothetical protein